MTMKRLALVVPALGSGGGVTSVARFVREAARNSGRYELKLVSLCMNSRDPASVRLMQPMSWRCGILAQQDDWEGTACVRVGAFFSEFEFQRYKPNHVLAAQLADVDLIQVVAGSPAWANTVLGLGKPVSLQVATRARVERRRRDASTRSLLGWWRRAMTELTDRFDDRALRRCDAIQVENPWMYEYAKSLNADRSVDLRYAPPGVDSNAFKPLLNRELASDPYILCVGRLADPRKNSELIGRAFAALVQKGNDKTRLVLAGNSAPPAAFWQVIDEASLRPRVTYLSGVSRADLIALYQHAAVFVLPSDEEGLGMVILEAMACGVPVVATRCGGPDGIIRDGTDGFLVPLNDAGAMAVHLGKLLNDTSLNLRLGRAARERIEANYSLVVTEHAFIDTWDRLLEVTCEAA